MKPSKTIFLCARLSIGLAHLAFTARAGDATAAVAAAAGAVSQPLAASPSQSPAVGSPGPAITGEYGADGLRMNFQGAPLSLVLDYLSEAAGFIINKQIEVRATVQVWSAQPVNKEEAIELLSSVLKKNGCAVKRSGRILTIFSIEAVKTADTEIVVSTDPSKVEKSDEVQTQIIPVRYATAAQLVRNLEQLLPTTATLSANESANTLILVATRTDIKRMLKIVTALDTAMASGSSLKVRPLRYADAKDTANLVTQLFSQQNSTQTDQGDPDSGPNFGGGPGEGAFGGGQPVMAQGAIAAKAGGRNSAAARVVAAADDRSNSVVISAPAGLLATIEDMLDKIDRQLSDVSELRVFRLVNADPSEMAGQLSELFPDQTSSNNSQDSSVPFFFSGGGGPGGAPAAAISGTSEHMKKAGKVLAIPDPRTSSVIVTASKTLMPQIAEMVAELDSAKGKREVVSYFELQHADPQDVSQNLQDLFNRNTMSLQNNNNQNSFLGRNNPLTQRQTQNQQASAGSATGFGATSGNTAGARSGP